MNLKNKVLYSKGNEDGVIALFGGDGGHAQRQPDFAVGHHLEGRQLMVDGLHLFGHRVDDPEIVRQRVISLLGRRDVLGKIKA